MLFGDLAISVGAGLRLNTPIALFRVDYAEPLSDGIEDKWIFTVGNAF